MIPADHKWFTRTGAAAVIANALIEIDPRYPVLDEKARGDLFAVKAELENEAPRGAAPDSFQQELAEAAARVETRPKAKAGRHK